MPHTPLCPLRLQMCFYYLQPRTTSTHTHAHMPVSNTHLFTHNQIRSSPTLSTPPHHHSTLKEMLHGAYIMLTAAPFLAHSPLVLTAFAAPSLSLATHQPASATHTCLHVTTPTSTHIYTSSTLPQTHVLKHTPQQTQPQPHALLPERYSSASDVLLATPSRASTSRPVALMPLTASPLPRVRILSQHHA